MFVLLTRNDLNSCDWFDENKCDAAALEAERDVYEFIKYFMFALSRVALQKHN